MNSSLGKILSLGLIAVSLAACGSSTTAAQSSTINTALTGSSAVAAGLIGFTGTTTSFGETTVLAGQIPNGEYAGNYGQVSAGAASVSTIATTTATSGSINYTQQRPAGTWGQLTFNASLASLQQLTFSGTIQLSSQLTQEIEAVYGTSAQVTSVGIWAVQYLNESVSYSGTSTALLPTFSGPLEQVEVWLYINGATVPVGPLVF